MLPILGCKVTSPFPFIPAVADTASHIYISRNDHLSERDTAFPTIPNIEFHFGFSALALLAMSGEDPDHGHIVVEDRLVQG